jgi:ethanolamine ammonia-lyase large subunit
MGNRYQADNEHPTKQEETMSRVFRWAVGVSLCAAITFLGGVAGAVTIKDVKSGEDVLAYMQRVNKGFDQTLYKQLVGAANPFKEADEGTGVAAADEKSRENARKLLANTKIRVFQEKPLFVDGLQELIWKTTDAAQYDKVKDWTLGDLKTFLLTKPP